jgi:hypothetical protein
VLFVSLVLIASVLEPAPAGAVTGFTLKAAVQPSRMLTGCESPPVPLPGPGVVSQATVIAGMECDDVRASNGGSVLVFEEPVTGWAGTVTESQLLYPGDPFPDGNFGSNVDIDGDTMVVGSQRCR